LENERGDALANASLFVHVEKIDGGRSSFWQSTKSNPDQPLSETTENLSKKMVSTELHFFFFFTFLSCFVIDWFSC